MASGSTRDLSSTTWPHFCGLCDVKMTCATIAISHFESGRHKDNVDRLDPDVPGEGQWPKLCTLCDNAKLMNPHGAKTHFEGKKHRQTIARVKQSLGNRLAKDADPAFNNLLQAVDKKILSHPPPQNRPPLLPNPYAFVPTHQTYTNSSFGRQGSMDNLASLGGHRGNQPHRGRGQPERRGRPPHRGHSQRASESMCDLRMSSDTMQAERGGQRGRSRGRGGGRGRGRGRGRDRRRGRGRGGHTGHGEGAAAEGSDEPEDSCSDSGDEEDDEQAEDQGHDEEIETEDEMRKRIMKGIVQELLSDGHKTASNLTEKDMDELAAKVQERMDKLKLGGEQEEPPPVTRPVPAPRSKPGRPLQKSDSAASITTPTTEDCMPPVPQLMDVYIPCKKAGSQAEGVSHSKEQVAADSSDSGSLTDDSSTLSTAGSVSSRSKRRRNKQRARNKKSQSQTQSEPQSQSQPKSQSQSQPKSQPQSQTQTQGPTGTGFDDFGLLKHVVKKYSGECQIRDLKADAFNHVISLPQPEKLLDSLIKSSYFKVFKTKDPAQKDNMSLIVVHHDGAKLCMNYSQTGCGLKFCPYIHLCKGLIQNSCQSRSCGLSHLLTDDHNGRVCEEKMLSQHFTPEEVLWILKCSTLQVCSNYNNGQCTLKDRYIICPQFHICEKFVRGRCHQADCAFGHDFFTSESKFLLSNSFYRLQKLSQTVLIKCVLVNDRHTRQTSELRQVPDKQAGHRSQRKREGPQNEGFQDLRESSEREIPGQKAQESEDAWLDVHIHDGHNVSNICEANLSRRCKYGSQKCRQHHYPLPYLWQVNMKGKWISLSDDNCSIEARYCDIRQDTYHIVIKLEDENHLCCIHFDKMMCSDTNDDQHTCKYEVRRLTTRSYTETKGPFVMQWRWYWLDNQSIWNAYEEDSFPYQDVVEAKFQSKQVACFFETGSHHYFLDFEKMKQINLQTQKSRAVRRRPVLISQEDVLGRKRPTSIATNVDKTKLPTGWAPMNTNNFTIPDLIPLKTSDKNYLRVKESFYMTLEPEEYEIINIIRVQNLMLWERYNRKEQEMQQLPHLSGDAQEKYLFHGTSSEYVVRCICKQGFDWRECGKNGTAYGNGSYFAADASYSNNYTDRQSTGKQYMFFVKVLVGKYTTGRSNYNKPPSLEDGSANSDLYDSCVNNVAHPRIFVIFQQDQSYPEYLIEYKNLRSTQSPPSVRRKSVGSVGASISKPSIKPKVSTPAYVQQVLGAQQNTAASVKRAAPVMPTPLQTARSGVVRSTEMVSPPVPTPRKSDFASQLGEALAPALASAVGATVSSTSKARVAAKYPASEARSAAAYDEALEENVAATYQAIKARAAATSEALRQSEDVSSVRHYQPRSSYQSTSKSNEKQCRVM